MANLPLNPIWHKQVRILFRRNLREQSRRLNLIFTSIIQTVIMAVLIGTVFPNIGQTQASIVRRQPVIFFCIINQGVFGALTVINSFPVERTLTLRERASGTYFASAYFIAKIIADTLVQLPIPILFVSLARSGRSHFSLPILSRASSTFSSVCRRQRASSSSSLCSCFSARSPRPRWRWWSLLCAKRRIWVWQCYRWCWKWRVCSVVSSWLRHDCRNTSLGWMPCPMLSIHSSGQVWMNCRVYNWPVKDSQVEWWIAPPIKLQNVSSKGKISFKTVATINWV